MRQRTPAIGAFAVAFVASLLVASIEGAKTFQGDSAHYWALGDAFVLDGSFSLLNFDSPLRGYLLPLLTHGMAEVAGGLDLSASSVVRTFNAAVLALIATVLAPSFARLAWPDRGWGFWRRLGVAVLLLVFWRSYMSFPLSDFPALAAVLLALVAAARADAPGWMLVAGLSSAAAVNLRPAYILIVPVVLALALAVWWRQRDSWRGAAPRMAACFALLFLGFAAVSLPQSLATHRHHDSWSPVPGSVAKLSSLQFTEGVRLQRYETYVGLGQPGPRMFYDDPTGQRILEQRGDPTINDAREYLGVIAGHPVDMAGVFARHVINGFDQRYPTPYVEQVDDGSQRWLRLAGFLLLFVALARVAWPPARRALGRARWRYPVALLLCGATSVASAVETRFLLPGYLLAYLLVLAPGWRPALAALRPGTVGLRPALALGVAFAVYMAVVLYVVGQATEHLRIA
jgi:hypothetical protein